MTDDEKADDVWCCEGRTPWGTQRPGGRPQVVIRDALKRFGIIQCDACGKEYGPIKLVWPRHNDNSAP